MEPQSLSSSPRGSVLGSALLIAGCCIGAAMLGLPVLTALAGFEPSLVMFVCSWLFMMTSGFLLLEVNLWFGDRAGIVTMAERTLGPIGKGFSWFLFLFLFYSIMVAYVVGSGSLIAMMGQELLGLTLTPWMGSLICVLLFGVLIYSGTTGVDYFNRFLMFGLITSYLGLVFMGFEHVETQNLKHVDWSQAWYVIPPMIISFGFHNMIPSVSYYLGTDQPKRLVRAIFLGSAIPLVIYLIWEYIILGIIPVEGEGGFRQALQQGDMATQALRSAVGSAWVVTLAEYFGFFAIVTSLLSVALSFVDFLADGLKVQRDHKGRALLCALTLVPPYLVGITYPTVFLTALNYAGAFGANILFGIIPALMVWKGRYKFGWKAKRLVPGGRFVLSLIIAFAMAVVFLQLAREIGWLQP
ncbi:MAG: aromatic amino acid transport family protein [Chlamydiales bacterium]|nr:aromatic amino acid transport family protein [Chlamydiales bacterium]